MASKFQNAKRLPKCWPTIQADALAMARFEFVALFVAYKTKAAEGRALVNGLRVAQVEGGWVYGFDALGPSCEPCDAAKLYDLIRRTDLGFYTRQAEEYRVDVHMAAA